ncbi:heme/copper-type cytochrome/quinol oxidase subunit 2 [Pseudoclavibacter chungangensis]|nr:hypothetical protein [Pseudoclavibacter chungangensis]NYJ65764.1 heme/copper-type cytochrome/quinol oxidase subunit 2 [Pseudoclavibacter chungangensis]
MFMFIVLVTVALFVIGLVAAAVILVVVLRAQRGRPDRTPPSPGGSGSEH